MKLDHQPGARAQGDQQMSLVHQSALKQETPFPPQRISVLPAATDKKTSQTEPLKSLTERSIIPGPEPMRFLGWRGNALRYFKNPIVHMDHLRRQYGNVACLAQGGNQPLFFKPTDQQNTTVFGFGASCNQEVLGQPHIFESALLRGPEECSWLSHNLVSANREHRSYQRRLMMPAFTKNHLKIYHNDLVSITDRMMSRWRAGQEIEMVGEMEHFSAAVASKIFYGQDLQEQHSNLATIAQKISAAMFSPVTMIPVNAPGSPYRRFIQRTESAGTAVMTEIRRRQEAGAAGDDVLSMMIRAYEDTGGKLSNDELIGNAFALFLAGTKAPASALISIFYLLAQHPQAMGALMEELDRELAGGPPRYDQLWKLPVLDSVIKESLRILSPAVILWRKPTTETTLGGHEIPIGSEVLISPYITHIDPAIYSEPKKYRPERWAGRKPSAFEYLPFSYGFRKCLGAALGDMMLKIAVAMVVQRHRLQLRPGSKIDLEVSFTMKPKNGLRMAVHPQDRSYQRSRADVGGFIRQMVELD